MKTYTFFNEPEPKSYSANLLCGNNINDYINNIYRQHYDPRVGCMNPPIQITNLLSDGMWFVKTWGDRCLLMNETTYSKFIYMTHDFDSALQIMKKYYIDKLMKRINYMFNIQPDIGIKLTMSGSSCSITRIKMEIKF